MQGIERAAAVLRAVGHGDGGVRLADLVEIAHENERLMARVHGFSLGLMRVDSLRATAARAAGITRFEPGSGWAAVK